MEFTSAKEYCLGFNTDFLSLLREQKNRYLTESSKESIDYEMKKSEDFKEYLIRAMRYCEFPKNLGEEYVLGEKAYIYIQAQDKAIAFSQSYCSEILAALGNFLKKTFAEYRNKIFYYELSPTLLPISEDEYKECKRFIEFFRGYEDEPLKKLGNIFKEIISNVCTIQ
ncbi:MAG: hypothetical protein ACSW8C_01425 [bacterium]